jgi:hypothetical protein
MHQRLCHTKLAPVNTADTERDAAAELLALRNAVLDAQIHFEETQADLERSWEDLHDAERWVLESKTRLHQYLAARGWRLVA